MPPVDGNADHWMMYVGDWLLLMRESQRERERGGGEERESTMIGTVRQTDRQLI